MQVPERSNVIPLPQAQAPTISPTFLAMAAAMMHQEGRLFASEASSSQRSGQEPRDKMKEQSFG